MAAGLSQCKGFGFRVLGFRGLGFRVRSKEATFNPCFRSDVGISDLKHELS